MNSLKLNIMKIMKSNLQCSKVAIQTELNIKTPLDPEPLIINT